MIIIDRYSLIDVQNLGRWSMKYFGIRFFFLHMRTVVEILSSFSFTDYQSVQVDFKVDASILISIEFHYFYDLSSPVLLFLKWSVCVCVCVWDVVVLLSSAVVVELKDKTVYQSITAACLLVSTTRSSMCRIHTHTQFSFLFRSFFCYIILVKLDCPSVVLSLVKRRSKKKKDERQNISNPTSPFFVFCLLHTFSFAD
jgi:hypothetical protein